MISESIKARFGFLRLGNWYKGNGSWLSLLVAISDHISSYICAIAATRWVGKGTGNRLVGGGFIGYPGAFALLVALVALESMIENTRYPIIVSFKFLYMVGDLQLRIWLQLYGRIPERGEKLKEKMPSNPMYFESANSFRELWAIPPPHGLCSRRSGVELERGTSRWDVDKTDECISQSVSLY